ncbi:unnamed protein product [Caenorhabditis auriculariae]|uniref:Uncharacterized protein n=1 Tax=Caenorhabditis auriculariae TaxID=2777116 RepID=A0A8S1HTK9_9PELO|nr:unnamed protein product [Caenorhabditis auriculariae]
MPSGFHRLTYTIKFEMLRISLLLLSFTPFCNGYTYAKLFAYDTINVPDYPATASEEDSKQKCDMYRDCSGYSTTQRSENFFFLFNENPVLVFQMLDRNELVRNANNKSIVFLKIGKSLTTCPEMIYDIEMVLRGANGLVVEKRGAECSVPLVAGSGRMINRAIEDKAADYKSSVQTLSRSAICRRVYVTVITKEDPTPCGTTQPCPNSPECRDGFELKDGFCDAI